MNTTLLAMLGWPEIIGILVIVLVLFGAKKVPELMRGLGSGIKEFKKNPEKYMKQFEKEGVILEDAPAVKK